MTPKRAPRPCREPSDGIEHRPLEETMNVNPLQLSEAIIAWTGWGVSARPARDESRVVEAFGEELAIDLMPAIREAEEEFYESDARHVVEDLAEMGETAAERFREAHPEIDDAAIRALAWCYTYDFK